MPSNASFLISKSELLGTLRNLLDHPDDPVPEEEVNKALATFQLDHEHLKALPSDLPNMQRLNEVLRQFKAQQPAVPPVAGEAPGIDNPDGQ